MSSFNHCHVEDCLWTMIVFNHILQGLGNQEVRDAQANDEHNEIGWKTKLEMTIMKMTTFSDIFQSVILIT